MSMPLYQRFALMFCILLLLFVVSLAQGTHSLQGKVIAPNGMQPSNAVKVTLTFNGMHIYETFTDLSGSFRFTGLGAGVYQLTAEGDGETFETTTVYADLSVLGRVPGSFTQNIQLSPKRRPAVKRAATVSVEELNANIPEKATSKYKQGVKKAEDNQPEQAIKLFQEAITAYADFYLARLRLAEQYAKLQRYDEATESYQKAIALRPKSAEALAGLGSTLVKQKKYGEAIAPLRQSLEMNSQSSAALLFLGFAEMMTGDYTASEKNLLQAYEMSKATIAHIYLANLYDLRGEPAKAIEQLQAFLKENPDAPNAKQIREVIEKLKKQAQIKK